MRLEILGFKQESLINYNLSLDEVLILKNIEDFINSGKTRSFYDEKDGIMYHWISYQKIIDDLPILNISKDRVSKIIIRNLSEKPEDFEEKFENYTERMKKESKSWKYLGLLNYKLVKNPVEGSRTYFALTDKFYELKAEIFDDLREGVNTDRQGVSTFSDEVFSPSADKVFPPSHDEVCTPSQTRCLHRPKDIYIYIKYIVEYLNEKTHKKYRYDSSSTQRLIQARLNEGYTKEDFEKVIDIKTAAWLGTDMEQYLRPKTLFNPSNFESYLNEASKMTKKEVPAVENNSGLSGFKEL